MSSWNLQQFNQFLLCKSALLQYCDQGPFCQFIVDRDNRSIVALLKTNVAALPANLFESCFFQRPYELFAGNHGQLYHGEV